MNKKISIAILGCRGIPASYGGFETIAQEVSKGLSSRGFEVYVSCEWRGFRARSFGDYHGVRLVYFPIIETIRNFSEPLLYDMLSLVWFAFRVDMIVMLGCYFPPSLIIPKVLRKGVIVHVDGLEWNRQKFRRLLKFLLKQFEKLSAKIADQIIVDSRIIGRYYGQNYRITPRYMPTGIKEIEPLHEEALRKFNIARDDYYLVIARLEPENNIDVIIEEFKRSGSKKKLVIVGPLTNSGYVRGLLKCRDDTILFLGGIYEPRLQRTLRHNCFGYIHGHEVGGANPSLIEALSCDNTVLALDCPYNREVAEEAAIYFKKDSGDLRKRIAMLEGLSNPERSRPSIAYTIYRRKYVVKNMVDAFEGLVRNLSTTRKNS